MLKQENKKNIYQVVSEEHNIIKEQTRGSVAFGLGLRADDQLAYKKNVSQDRLLPAVESPYLGNCILPIFEYFETLVTTEQQVSMVVTTEQQVSMGLILQSLNSVREPETMKIIPLFN